MMNSSSIAVNNTKLFQCVTYGCLSMDTLPTYAKVPTFQYELATSDARKGLYSRLQEYNRPPK